MWDSSTSTSPQLSLAVGLPLLPQGLDGVGSAGVGSSTRFAEGFWAPMENNVSTVIRTGVAMMDLEKE